MIDLFGADRAGRPARTDDRSARPASVRRRLRAYRSARREQRGDRPPPRVAVPSFFTLMNLLCGFLALTQVANTSFVMACWLIVLAGFFDLLDGMMARLTGADSSFGVQLDSLSDMVSFGVAPSFLLYGYVLDAFNPLGVIVAALPALCGAVRLARYNMTADESDKEGFEGLPIPGQAIAVVALVLAAENSTWDGRFALDSLRVVLPVVVVLSGLMVSSIRFDAIPMPSLKALRRHPRKMSAYGLAGLLIVGLQERGLLIVLAVYLLHGMGRSIYKLARVLLAPVPDGPLGS
ncbi:CDP-diacylglycerol--serine O-phosphatidyltransferase [Salinibacter altiplanensis]|uniref:CDP-diacylglycerol--serine O-phosphatidyltransferase n=1 Tax=Salinibacter altiplanensis TaxID=1803181 RepID=UPI000C9EDFAA|nr:CDP-diacylglycerol--serine O-phosphatidyltransferase [Salinibacter altiplanensis]